MTGAGGAEGCGAASEGSNSTVVIGGAGKGSDGREGVADSLGFGRVAQVAVQHDHAGVFRGDGQQRVAEYIAQRRLMGCQPRIMTERHG